MRGKIKRALAGPFVLLLALCLSAGLDVGLKGHGMYREALEQKQQTRDENTPAQKFQQLFHSVLPPPAHPAHV